MTTSSDLIWLYIVTSGGEVVLKELQRVPPGICSGLSIGFRCAACCKHHPWPWDNDQIKPMGSTPA